MPIQDMNIHSAISSGGKDTFAPIYWPRHIHILNRHGGSNLQDEYSVYMASPNTIGAAINERNILTPLHLFVVTMPISKAVASGKGTCWIDKPSASPNFDFKKVRHYNLQWAATPDQITQQNSWKRAGGP
jgi:hypothetical protein